jgi:hypothetical protein
VVAGNILVEWVVLESAVLPGEEMALEDSSPAVAAAAAGLGLGLATDSTDIDSSTLFYQMLKCYKN